MGGRSRFLWKLRTRGLALGERTLVMAIVNLTPDSFSGDGVLRAGEPHPDNAAEAGTAAALHALDEGADLLDLGAESTRPDAVPISAMVEQERLLPVLRAVLRARPEAVVSVDTYHAATARAAAALGAEIVNDVSGLAWDDGMAQAVADTRCGLVLMHTRGKPQEWRSQAPLPQGTAAETVRAGLRERLTKARQAGIPDEAIVLDPGFGFGKRGRENLELLGNLPMLGELGRPLLVGLSRKGFLGEVLASLHAGKAPAPADRDVATLAANVAAMLGGAHIARVHEVRRTREAMAVADAVLGTQEAAAASP